MLLLKLLTVPERLVKLTLSLNGHALEQACEFLQYDSSTGAVGTYFCDKVYRDDYLPESEEFLLALISLPFTVFLATILGPGSVTGT